ncbi:MAG: hypothetical protein ACOCV2_14285 [Persicimonas sp.]
MAYKRAYYHAEFKSGMSEQDKEDFLQSTFVDGCANDVGGVIARRPEDGVFAVFEGPQAAVDKIVASLDNAKELVDNGEACSQSLSSYDEGLALYLAKDVSNTCNYD